MFRKILNWFRQPFLVNEIFLLQWEIADLDFVLDAFPPMDVWKPTNERWIEAQKELKTKIQLLEEIQGKPVVIGP